jgi:hypothetical protein
VSAAADVCVLLVARAAGVPLAVPMPLVAAGEPMPWYVPALVAALAVAAGAACAWLLPRYVANAPRTFGWLVAVVAVASCLPLLALGLPAASTAVLVSMHLVPAAVVLALLWPAVRTERPC